MIIWPEKTEVLATWLTILLKDVEKSKPPRMLALSMVSREIDQ